MTTTIESKPATKMTKATFTTDDCCFVCLSTFSKILHSLLLQGSCSRFYELQEESLHLVKFPRGRPIIKAGYCRMMMMVLKRMNLHFGLRSTRQILGVTFEEGLQIANCNSANLRYWHWQWLNSCCMGYCQCLHKSRHQRHQSIQSTHSNNQSRLLKDLLRVKCTNNNWILAGT